MEPLEIRDRRYRAQQRLETLRKQLPDEDDADGEVSPAVSEEIDELERRIATLQEECPHEHVEEDEEKGLWRCRDCDVRNEIEQKASTPA